MALAVAVLLLMSPMVDDGARSNDEEVLNGKDKDAASVKYAELGICKRTQKCNKSGKS